MKKILIIMMFISSALFAGEFENYINYKTLKEYKNYFSEGHVEINKTPTSLVMNTQINKKYILFIHSTSDVEISVFTPDGFSDIRKYRTRGVFPFKATGKTVMVVVNGKGYTKVNWGTY